MKSSSIKQSEQVSSTLHLLIWNHSPYYSSIKLCCSLSSLPLLYSSTLSVLFLWFSNCCDCSISKLQEQLLRLFLHHLQVSSTLPLLSHTFSSFQSERIHRFQQHTLRMSQVLHHSPLYPQRFATVPEAAFPNSRDTTSIAKKRRGRQPRQSLLTSSLRNSIARFTGAVGSPVVQPAGFRDFNGWLQIISQPSYKPAWHALCRSFISESAKISSRQIPTLKKDVIHEIINNVVKRKSHESAKLISTNARRQSTIPPSGHTVMTIFESYLATVPSSSVTSYASSGFTQSRHEKYQSQHHPINSILSAGSHHPVYNSSATVFPHISDSYSSKRVQSSTPSPTNSSSRDASIASLSPKSSRSSSRTSSGSPRTIAASNMDISSLLIDDYEAALSRKQSSYRRLSSSKSKLPSLSQFDEQIRQRSVKERFYWFAGAELIRNGLNISNCCKQDCEKAGPF